MSDSKGIEAIDAMADDVADATSNGLEWDWDGDGQWSAYSDFGAGDDGPFGYEIVVSRDGQFCVNSDTSGDNPKPLPTLAAAKAWCEQREAELRAKASTPVVPTA